MSVVERPVTFGDTLIGVSTSPDGDRSPGKPTFVFLNAGIIHRVGPNRLYVRLARELARNGIPSLRFDLPGIGDSNVPQADEALTSTELVDRSVDSALDYLEARGHRNGFVALGLCSGADNAFRAATRDERVVGAAMLDPDVHRTAGFYLHHYGRRLFRARSWLNVVTGRHPYVREMLRRLFGGDDEDEEQESPFLAPTTLPPREERQDELEGLVRRGVQLFCLFTGGLEQRYNHEGQFHRAYRDVDFRGCLEHDYWPGSDHTFTRSEHREQLRSRILEWATETQFPAVGVEEEEARIA